MCPLLFFSAVVCFCFCFLFVSFFFFVGLFWLSVSFADVFYVLEHFFRLGCFLSVVCD